MGKLNAGLLKALLVMLAFGHAAADGIPKPVQMSKAQIQGTIFSKVAPVVMEEEDSDMAKFKTEDVEAFLSSDRRFDAGAYGAGPNRFTIDEPYGVNEFMYFIEGGVKLTSADGRVMEINAGDAVVIPKEWTGIWETAGYTKIYVIYPPDEPMK